MLEFWAKVLVLSSVGGGATVGTDEFFLANDENPFGHELEVDRAVVEVDRDVVVVELVLVVVHFSAAFLTNFPLLLVSQ